MGWILARKEMERREEADRLWTHPMCHSKHGICFQVSIGSGRTQGQVQERWPRRDGEGEEPCGLAEGLAVSPQILQGSCLLLLSLQGKY